MESNDDLKKNLLSLESYQEEYKITLNEYNTAYKNYMDEIDTNSTNNTNTNNTTYMVLSSRTWWAGEKNKEGSVTNIKECESMCASDLTCSGATFNNKKNYCWTRTGDGKLTTGSDDFDAILPAKKKYVMILNYLNEKLQGLINKINNEMKKTTPEVVKMESQQQQLQETLKTSYSNLLNDKLEINALLTEYNTIENSYEAQNIYVSQQNSLVRIWTIVTLIIILIVVKQLVGFTSISLIVVFWVGIIILMIILSFSLSRPSGFMSWGLLIVYLLLSRLNII